MALWDPDLVIDHGLFRPTKSYASSWADACSASSVGTVTTLAVRRSSPSAARTLMTSGTATVPVMRPSSAAFSMARPTIQLCISRPPN